MAYTLYNDISHFEPLIKRGVAAQNIRFMSLVVGLDSHLNAHAYIVPGLGDAGDRIFGTKH